MLALERPADWDFSWEFEGFAVRRGWMQVEELHGVLTGLREDHLVLGETRFRLRADEGHGRYTWILNSNLTWLRKRIGWPSIQLKGSGGEQSHRCGYELHDRIERHLPVAKPRRFRGWEGLAAFLGGEAEPLSLGQSMRCDFECYAPTYARLAEIDWGKDLPRHPGAIVECRLRPIPCDLTIIVDAGTAEGPTTIPIADRKETRPNAWDIPLDLPPQPEKYSIMLAMNEQIIERVEPGAWDLRFPNTRVLANELHGARDDQERDDSSSAPVAASVESIHLRLADLHPTLLSRCESQLRSGHYDEAILNAFKVVEEELRARCGAAPGTVGVELATRAFSPKTGNLVASPVPAEQEGAHALFRGAIGYFKNPQSHRFVGVQDEHIAFELLAVASVLLRILDAARNRSLETVAETQAEAPETLP